MPESVIRMILKAMEHIPDSRENRRRNNAPKREINDAKISQKREIKVR